MKIERGFTLVELLVALVVLALIASMAFRGLASVIETRSRVAEESRKWRDISLFFSRLDEDLSNLSHLPFIDASGIIQPEFSGKDGFSDPFDASFVFTLAGQDGENPERIGYRFNKGKIEELVWAHPDAAPGAKPAVYVLLDHAKKFKLRYLSANNAWVSYWPLPGQARPKAVEASLTLGSGEEIVRIFSLI